MDKKTNISDSELEVLKELWLLPSLTARQLTDRLLERTNWSEPTIKTLLLRLLRKKCRQTHPQRQSFYLFSIDYAGGIPLSGRLQSAEQTLQRHDRRLSDLSGTERTSFFFRNRIPEKTS